MKFIINEENDDSTVVISLEKSDSGDIEILANDGQKSFILFSIRTSGYFSRVGFVEMFGFKTDGEGRIEEEEL